MKKEKRFRKMGRGFTSPTKFLASRTGAQVQIKRRKHVRRDPNTTYTKAILDSPKMTL